MEMEKAVPRVLLRTHCMLQWFSFSARQMEDAPYQIESVCRFAGFGGVTDTLPDETTHLKAHDLLVSEGTMADATIVHTPSSTKAKARDTDMHSIQKATSAISG